MGTGVEVGVSGGSEAGPGVGMAVAMGSDTAGVVEGVGTEVGVGAGVAWGVTDGATGGGVGVAAGVEAGNESGSGVGVGRVVGATVIEVGVGFVGVADGLTGVGVEVAGTAVLEGIVTGAGAVAVALCVSGFSGAWGGWVLLSRLLGWLHPLRLGALAWQSRLRSGRSRPALMWQAGCCRLRLVSRLAAWGSYHRR